MQSNKFDFSLVRADAQTLDRQLYQQMRQWILNGDLRPAERLPSTRELAQTLGVSRSTVVDAYRQLIAEGYLEAKAKSSTIVCTQLPEKKLETGVVTNFSTRLTELGRRLMRMDFAQHEAPNLEIAFYSWRTCFGELPLEQWTRNLWRRSRENADFLVDFSKDRCGSDHLRESIAEYVRQSRGIECEPDQVFITLGHQQALDMVARLFVSKGDRVALEEPSFPENRNTLLAHGGKLIPVNVDESGMMVDHLARKFKHDIKLACVTPSHQYPTGAVLTMSRRLELLDWARKSGALIIEDDYDSDYRFVGKPIPSLASLDKTGLVIYIATASKVLYPAFSLGYMIVPKELQQIFAAVRRLGSDSLPPQFQEAFADFIDEGHLKRHIKHMRPIYEERRTALVESLKTLLPTRATIHGDNAGLHIMVDLKTTLPEAVLIRKCARVGVGLISTQSTYAEEPPTNQYIFGYGNLTPEQIKEGLKRLAKILQESE